MEALNVVEDIGPGLGSGTVLPAIHPFPFEHAEEAFTGGVIGTIAHAAHTAHQVVPAEEALIVLAGELTATIRVQNDRGTFVTLP